MNYKIEYDEKEDTFGIFTIPNRPAITIEVEDNILLRLDPETNEFISLEILFFKNFVEELIKWVNIK